MLAPLAMTPAQASAVGFATVSVDDPPGIPLHVGIWYSTDASASPQRLELYMQSVAPDAAIAGTALPLVVISHGNGGSYAGHYDTALALAGAGFVVAAMTHTGDNWRDQSRALHLQDRARAVHAVIGYMLTAWAGHARIDPARVGMFGFSAGGFTALVAAGGVPDYAALAPYCARHPDSYVCALIKGYGVTAAHPVPEGTWIADSRIKAAVVAAPALGFAFDGAGLSRVTIPIQLWRAEFDHVLPSPDFVEPVRDALPRPPEYHVVVVGDHFDFLAPCSPALAAAAPAICESRPGFDRAAFHASFDREVVRFFNDKFQR